MSGIGSRERERGLSEVAKNQWDVGYPAGIRVEAVVCI